MNRAHATTRLRVSIATLIAIAYASALLVEPASAAPNPTITQVQPGTAANTGSVTVVLTGSGFQSGATVAMKPHQPSGLPAQTVAGTIVGVPSAVSMTATFNLASVPPSNLPASPGSWDITVTNPDATAGGCVQCFSVTGSAPTVSSVSPTGLVRGTANANVAIVGTNFALGTAVSFSPSAGITINSTTITDAQHLTANISLAVGAASGSRTLTVTNTDNQTGSGSFTVLQGPNATSTVPGAAANTAPVTLTITGTGFETGDTVSLELSGQSSIPGTSVNVSSATTLTATFDVTLAAPSPWDIRVANANGVSNVCPACFPVTSNAPTVSSVSPASGGQGAISRALTINGSNLANGSVVSFAGTGVTVDSGSTKIQSAHAIALTVTIAAGATTGAHDVTVTNTDSQSGTCASPCFTVNAAPTATGLTPSARGPSVSQSISITGTGFVSGATASFGPKIAVNSTTFVDSTHLTASISVAPDAVTGARDITVTNPDGGVATCTGCFTVNAGPSVSSPTSQSPSTLGQGATTQNISIVGSNFVSGAVAAFNGNGVTVNSTTFVDASHLTANVTVAANATIAVSDFTVTNPDAGTVRCTGCFSVAGAPAVTAASPGALGQGASAAPVAISGSGFAQGATAAFGQGITVNTTTVSNAGATATSSITIAATATPGPRDITITNPNSGNATCHSCFTVNAAPAITTVSPSSRGQGATSQVITISGTGFLSGATVAFGSGITQSPNTTVVVDQTHTHLTVTIDVASNATAVPSNITVTNPDSSTPAVCQNCFTVNAGPSFPANVSGASPSSRGAGSASQTITVTGVNFASGVTAAISPGTNMSVTSTTFVDATHLTMVVSIDPTAATGTRDIVATNSDGGSARCIGCFTINAPPTVSLPLTPSSYGQGATSQTITVAGTNFLSGATASFSGTDITVNSTTFNSSTQLTVNLSIAANASTTTSHTITITNPDAGSATCATLGCFNVTVAPSVTSTSPSSSGQGASSQAVTVTGSNFVSGATVSFGAGITVNGNPTFQDSSHLTANISVASGATTGGRTVTVTNPDKGVGSCASTCFTVNPAPTASAASPSSRGQGATSQTITITGTGFVSGATASFPVAGVSVSSTTVTDSTHLSVVISVDPGTATTARDITITNPDGGVGTCTGCLSVAQAPGVSSSSPSAVSNSAPVTITITGTGFVSGATVSMLHAGQSDIPGTSVVFNSSTSLKATFDVTGAAPMAWGLRVTNPDGGNSSCSGCFTVAGSAPTITSASPNVGSQGSTRSITLTGSNFAKGATISVTGTGITINSTSFVDTTHLALNITIDPSADTTVSRNITVTNTDSRTATCASCFAVDLSPTATSASPSSRGQGAVSQIISVTGTNFASGVTAAFSGTGVSVNSVSFVDASHASVTIMVAGAAPVGSRDITLTNPDGGTVVCHSCFTVNAAPSVTSASPAALGQTAVSKSVMIVGAGLQSGATVSFSGTGVTLNSSSLVDATHLTLNVSVTPSAAPGARDILVTNPDGGTTAVCSSCFTVDAAPTVSSVSPSSRGHATTAQGLTITGSGFTSGSLASFSGTGVTVTSSGMIDSQHLGVAVSIASNALDGARDLTILNPDGGLVVCTGCFTVNPMPALTSLSPNAFGQGATSKQVTLIGSGFLSGATASISGTGASLNSVSFVDATHLHATITVSTGAPTGARDLTVTNPDGSPAVACTGCLTVNAAPTVSSVGPGAIGAGAPAQDVVINETGLQSGASISFGAGITVNSVSVLDASHGSANVTVTSGAAPGSRDIVITNPDSGAPATCAGCFNVLPAGLQGSLSIDATPSSGTLGEARTISGTLTCNGSLVPFDSMTLSGNGSSRSVRTDGNGAWSFTDKPWFNTTYSASWPGNSACLGGASSSEVPIHVSVSIPVSVSRTSLPARSAVYLWGQVLPSKRGKIVKLQLLNGATHTWVDVSHMTLSGPNYSFRYVLASKAYRLLRIAFRTQDSLNQWGVSRYVKVTWY